MTRQLLVFVLLVLAACRGPVDPETERLSAAEQLIGHCEEARQADRSSHATIHDGASATPWISELGDGVVCFDGLIVAEVVEEFSGRAESIETLVVRSLGGEGPAGILIGESLSGWNTHVIVWDRCFSACASYLFTAAGRQTVPEPGVVGWHQGLAYTRYGALLDNSRDQSEEVQDVADFALRRLFETGRNDVPDRIWEALPASVHEALNGSRGWRLRIQRLHTYAGIPEGMQSAHHLVRARMPEFAGAQLDAYGSVPNLFWTPGQDNLQAWGFDDVVMWRAEAPEDILALGLSRTPPTSNIRKTINPGDFPVRDGPDLVDDSADWPLEGLVAGAP